MILSDPCGSKNVCTKVDPMMSSTIRFNISEVAVVILYHLTIDNPSQSRFGAIKVTGHFSLNDELKKNLHINKKRIHVCASHEDFQALLSCFHNHEVS